MFTPLAGTTMAGIFKISVDGTYYSFLGIHILVSHITTN